MSFCSAQSRPRNALRLVGKLNRGICERDSAGMKMILISLQEESGEKQVGRAARPESKANIIIIQLRSLHSKQSSPSKIKSAGIAYAILRDEKQGY